MPKKIRSPQAPAAVDPTVTLSEGTPQKAGAPKQRRRRAKAAEVEADEEEHAQDEDGDGTATETRTRVNGPIPTRTSIPKTRICTSPLKRI